MYDFNERFRVLREESGMNQQEFAKKLGTSKATVSRYENGLMKPTIEAALNIAEKCNVTLDWLAGRGTIDNIERRN